jgi:hypothetical protein
MTPGILFQKFGKEAENSLIPISGISNFREYACKNMCGYDDIEYLLE